MSWYYAEKGERRGPISDGEFNTLLKSNVITAETLVWQDGMLEWRPYGQLAKDSAPPQQVAQEEVSPQWDVTDAAALEEHAKARSFSVNSCIWRAFQLLRNNFMLCAGTTFIVYAMVVFTQLIPVLGSILGSILNGPLMAGLLWFLLLLIRGENATLGDGFAGFKREFVHLVMCALFSGIVVTLCMLPGTSQLGLAEMVEKGAAPNFAPLTIILLVAGGIAALYLTVAWIFALPLIIDKGLGWREALRLSRRIGTRHWWRLFLIIPAGGALVALVLAVTLTAGTMLDAALAELIPKPLLLAIRFVLASVALSGVACLLPIFFGALMYAYEDLFGQPKHAEASESVR